MMQFFSRYGSKRVFLKLTDDLVEYISYDTFNVTTIGENDKDPIAIDSDGGPFLQKNQIININKEEFKINNFKHIDYCNNKNILNVLLDVKKLN